MEKTMKTDAVNHLFLPKLSTMKKGLGLFFLWVLVSCSNKKIDLSGELPLKLENITSEFKKITSTTIIADSNLLSISDTVVIGRKAFNQFFPDSIFTKEFPLKQPLQIRAIGIIEKEKEKYLLASVGQQKKTKLLLLVTDQKFKYLAHKYLLQIPNKDGYRHSVTINKEPSFLINKELTDKDQSIKYTKVGWIFSPTGDFMVVMNDSNEDLAKKEIINPIDTFPNNNRFSGDYVRDKKNFISIRDTKKNNQYEFFIHFEKNEGACIGELRGLLIMKDNTHAQFTQNGDPCVIDFQFDGNSISIKEQGTCGNYRGIQCFFNDEFTKRKKSKKAK